MHSDPQISLHEMVPAFRFSHAGRIHRCSTVYFIRFGFTDKTAAPTRQRAIFTAKMCMFKPLRTLFIAATAVIAAGCATNQPSIAPAQSAAAQRDYDLLTGTWQLTRGVDNGKPVPANVARNTILITDHNTFRFPKASGIGTHPAGRFTINPDTTPKQVDSIAEGGPNVGQLTRGIYEIIDPTHKRACWGPPGGPRPTQFRSPPGSHRILQYWKKIGPVPAH